MQLRHGRDIFELLQQHNVVGLGRQCPPFLHGQLGSRLICWECTLHATVYWHTHLVSNPTMQRIFRCGQVVPKCLHQHRSIHHLTSVL